MRILGVFLLLAVGIYAEKKSYEGYQILRVVPTTDDQVAQLQALQENVELDFWTEPIKGKPTDINIPPNQLKSVRKALRRARLPQQVIQNNVQKLIDSELESNELRTELLKALAAKGVDHPNAAKFISNGKGPQWFKKALDEVKAELSEQQKVSLLAGPTNYNIVNTFPRYDAVLSWMDGLKTSFPDLVTIESIGETFQKRIMKVIKIGKADSKGTVKPIIWIDSAIHAREWLTVGTTVWIINKLLTTYATDTEVRDLVDYYDWYFLPVSNPDGYEYTHTGDRLWRKTRSTNTGSSCIGTDPNRNWDYKWRVSGTSTNPCSDTYGGPSAFSEKCTQNMRNKILSLASRIKLYMGVHSYSQMWLTPWAWGGSKPTDYADLLRVANSGNAALRAVHGTRFTVGTPPDILYSASGGAYDWAKAVAGIKYAYTFELRPDNYAYNGFVVDETEIEPSGEEIFAALSQIAEDIKSG